MNTNILNFTDVIGILDDAKQHRVFLMPISGGDPLLHPNFFEIIKNILQRNILPLLGVTGVGIDRQMAQKIKGSGIPSVQVSLDGYNEETNSLFRGKGVFQEVIRSIHFLIQENIKTNLAICVNAKNILYIQKMLDLAKKLGVYKVKIAFWEPSGDIKDRHEYELTAQQQSNAGQLCLDYQRKYNIPHWITSPSSYFGNANPNSAASKYPPLVIHPNGNFTVSEFGPTIGNICEGLPSYFYKRFLETKGLN